MQPDKAFREKGLAVLRTLQAGFLAVGLFSSATPAIADFKSDLAQQFNADARYFVVNLPPRPGGWPGSIYTSDMRFAVVRGTGTDPSIESGPPFDLAASLSLELSGKAEAGIGRLFGLSAAASNTAAAAVTFKQTKIYDLTLQQIRDRVMALSEDQRRPPGPVVVYRTYEGIPTLTLARRSEANAEAWATLKKGLVEAGFEAAAASGDSITIQSADRVLFAFEIAQVTDVGVLTNASNAAIGKSKVSSILGASIVSNIGVVANGKNTIRSRNCTSTTNPDGTVTAECSITFEDATQAHAFAIPSESAVTGGLIESLPSRLVGLERVSADFFERVNPAPTQ